MALRGWVYVLSNSGFPELVKVGFSTKDPGQRAAELDGTGVPFPYVVAYDVLVEEPRDVEQAVHQLLRHAHANKEFFKTSVAGAVEAIRLAIFTQGKVAIVETGGTPAGTPLVSIEPIALPVESEAEAIQRRLRWGRAPGPFPSHKFSGISQAVTCVCCGYVYSIGQVNSEKVGEAECPECLATNRTPFAT